jgi:hypothetical protein
MFTAFLSASVLVGWTHGGGQVPGSNVIDDLGNLVVDDIGNQVVTS